MAGAESGVAELESFAAGGGVVAAGLGVVTAPAESPAGAPVGAVAEAVPAVGPVDDVESGGGWLAAGAGAGFAVLSDGAVEFESPVSAGCVADVGL